MERRFDEKEHRYYLGDREIPGITRVLQSFGFGANPFYTEYGRDRGTFVHQATELYDRGELDEATLDPVLAPYLEGWKKFRTETEFEPTRIEERLWVELRGYATTVDRVGIIGTSAIDLEIKCGKEEPWHRLQTGGQSYACRINGIKVDHRAAVYLSQEGTYRMVPHKDKSDEEDFLALVSAYHVKTNYGGQS